MKPLNSKERTKQVWQFIFIFFMLAVAPTAIIFFSYYKVPLKMREEDQRRLLSFSSFEKNQKLLVKNISLIDSNLSILVNENSSDNAPEVLKANIAKSLLSLKDADTGRLMTAVTATLNHHLVHVNKLLSTRNEMKESEEELKKANKELGDCKSAMNRMGMGAMMPPTE
jgi:hypothetical protein